MLEEEKLLKAQKEALALQQQVIDEMLSSFV